MTFAWEEDVQRCSRFLLCAFMVLVLVLTGAFLALGSAQHPMTAEERTTRAAIDSKTRSTDDLEQRGAISDEESLLFIEQHDGP
jgi:hypothetical protein